MTEPTNSSEWYSLNGFCLFFESAEDAVTAMHRDEIPGNANVITRYDKKSTDVTTYIELPVSFDRAREIALAVGGKLDVYQREFYRKS